MLGGSTRRAQWVGGSPGRQVEFGGTEVGLEEPWAPRFRRCGHDTEAPWFSRPFQPRSTCSQDFLFWDFGTPTRSLWSAPCCHVRTCKDVLSELSQGITMACSQSLYGEGVSRSSSHMLHMFTHSHMFNSIHPSIHPSIQPGLFF